MTAKQPFWTAVGALTMAVFWGHSAAYAASDCRQSQILAGQKKNHFKHISWRLDPAKGTEILVRGKPYALGSPESCDLEGPNQEEIDSDSVDDLDYSCKWEFADQAKAQAFYDVLSAEMRKCLSAKITTEGKGAPYSYLIDLGSTEWKFAFKKYYVEGEIDLTGFADRGVDLAKDPDSPLEKFWVKLELTYYSNTLDDNIPDDIGTDDDDVITAP